MEIEFFSDILSNHLWHNLDQCLTSSGHFHAFIEGDEVGEHGEETERINREEFVQSRALLLHDSILIEVGVVKVDFEDHEMELALFFFAINLK